MKSIKYFLAVVIIANSTLAVAGPAEEAEIAIAVSHAAARKHANELLRQDLDVLVQNLVQTSRQEFPRTGPSIPEQIKTLNQRIVDQLDRNTSIQKMDVAELNSLVDSYESLVRERFRASFSAQELVTQKYLALRAFELPLEGFATMCRTGRSAINLIGAPPVIPRLPDAEYSIFVSWGSSDSKVAFNSATPTQASADRNKAQTVLGGAAGISGAFVAQGVMYGAAATNATMVMVAPYLAAAYLAFAIVNGVISNNEAVALQNEAVEASVNLMHRSATDRDVARYYTESCKEAMEGLQPVYDMIQKFKISDAKRAEVVQALESTAEARTTYWQEAQKMLPVQAMLGLATLIESKQCDDNTQKLCKKEGSVYSLIGNPEIKIDVTSDADKKLVKEAQKQNLAFTAKYPRKTELLYHSHAVMESVIKNWNEISNEVENSSFQVADQTMAALAQKLRSYIYEVQKSKNSAWANSIKLTGAEQRLQDQYFSLRAQYFQLLTNALKIFFNRADAAKGKLAFQQFLKRFNSFAAETNIHPDIQAMNQSVQSLKRFYEKL